MGKVRRKGPDRDRERGTRVRRREKGGKRRSRDGRREGKRQRDLNEVDGVLELGVEEPVALKEEEGEEVVVKAEEGEEV